MKIARFLALFCPVALLCAGCQSTHSPIRPEPIVQTNVVTLPSGQSVTNTVTNTIYVVNPDWQRAIDAARGVNETFNPTPTAPLVNIGLGALSTVLGLIAAWKSRQAKSNGEQLETVVQGVEIAGNSEVKAKIEEVSRVKGVASDLASTVKAITTPSRS